ncbi:MAG: hypothetical protein AAF727_17510, partial [Pseudomonadota bacterium]
MALTLLFVLRTAVDTLRPDLPPVTSRLAIASVHTVLATPLLWGLTLLFHTTSPSGGLLALGVVVLSLNLVFLVLETGNRTLHLRDANEGLQPRLLNRLPAEQRGALIRISVRDHYVDIVTVQGVTSLLMRFSDAMAELGA